MDNLVCENCVYFRQHFVLDKQRSVAVNCGHCVYPRIKHRQAKHKACAKFEKREEPVAYPDREQVVNYLTTEFLQYVLSLELPPEICK